MRRGTCNPFALVFGGTCNPLPVNALSANGMPIDAKRVPRVPAAVVCADLRLCG